MISINLLVQHYNELISRGFLSEGMRKEILPYTHRGLPLTEFASLKFASMRFA